MKPVSYSPAMKAGWRITRRWNARFVWMPPTWYSPSARRMRSMAAGRVSAQAHSFEIIGS